MVLMMVERLVGKVVKKVGKLDLMKDSYSVDN
jgi:hypothetical protein